VTPTNPTSREEVAAVPHTDRHAIVVGASLAGLATAAALAARFDRVTVVDRDTLPADGRPRTGVPQGRHGHILLPAGLQELTALLPGITDDLQAHGAHLLPVGEIRFHAAGDHLALDDTGLQLVGATRPLLESVVRSRVRGLGNVEIADGVDARSLALDGGDRVTGLRVRERGGGPRTTLDADLVVDAAGRGSPSPRWLADAGIAPPDEDRFAVGVHYATRLFRRRPDDLDGCRHVVVGVPPDGRRGGFAVAVEGGRCLVTLVGVLGERPPTDLDGFVAYARTLDSDDLHVLVDHAEPVSEPSTGAFPAYRRRRYDRLPRLPDGYVVLGDAVCSFNPLYAQGMTMALREAALLGRIVDRHGTRGVGVAFLRQVTPLIDAAWTLGTGADLGHREIEGPRTVTWRLLDRYSGRLLRVAHRDPVVANTYLRVIALVEPMQAILRPRVAWRVLAGPRSRAKEARDSRQPASLTRG
jgi:2-polyprenyl-6-methoxyphenol hydroxylase-like FAD-dependent oxidoreductase